MCYVSRPVGMTGHEAIQQDGTKEPTLWERGEWSRERVWQKYCSTLLFIYHNITSIGGNKLTILLRKGQLYATTCQV